MRRGGMRSSDEALSQIVTDFVKQHPWISSDNDHVHPKGDQSWVFIGRTDIEVEAPILWPPAAKS